MRMLPRRPAPMFRYAAKKPSRLIYWGEWMRMSSWSAQGLPG
jgi:hypothetical protein